MNLQKGFFSKWKNPFCFVILYVKEQSGGVF